MEEEAEMKTSVEAFSSSPDPVRVEGTTEAEDPSFRANGGAASASTPLSGTSSPPQALPLRTSYGGGKKAEASGRFALKRAGTSAWGSAVDGRTLRGEVDQVAQLLQGANSAAKRGGGGGGGDSSEVAEMVGEMRKEVGAVSGRVDDLGKQLDAVQTTLGELLKRLPPPTNI